MQRSTTQQQNASNFFSNVHNKFSQTNPCLVILHNILEEIVTVMYETHPWISTLLWEENWGACGGDTQQDGQIINVGDNSPVKTR